MPARRSLFKMVGGAVCPPGLHCMTTSTVLTTILAGVAILAIVVFIAKTQGWLGTTAAAAAPTVVVVKTPTAPAGPTVVMTPPDPRFAPPAPEQAYNPSFGGGVAGGPPINVATRGYPEPYQQIGVLTAPGGTDMSASPNRTVLPLFGRKLTTNRDRWNYYTRTDGMNPVQVPLQYKRRNCDDDLGCEEIMDGESVAVPILGNSYVANVYRYATPRYLPV
jgi:hypothetical protein